MLDSESQWSEAFSSNNIRAIIRWLRKLTAEGEADTEETLQAFSCWVQRTSEFVKKEFLTLCFSRCHGLWMFLDRSSFSRVHVLLQKLRNLLTLAHWARRQLGSAHLWHGVGVPCVVCRDTFSSSDVKQGCWNREHRALKQHIWLGRLVQWWGIMGLLPKYPEAHEVKRITQMWRDMDQSHRKACLETPGFKAGQTERLVSLIQGMVTQLDRQHGCMWITEDCTEQYYPPPNLQALLKLVMVPHIDNLSVQALLMYFVLDIAKFLQCKDDLLQSFCKAFTIPSSSSQQIRAFWMLDHGHIKAAMELLLSPKAAVPGFLWQHRCIIRSLLTRKQPQLALRYLHWAKPPVQSVEDAKLCARVLLQNSCVSDAWTLLKRGHTESDNMVLYFLQACNGLGLCAEALKYIPAGYDGEGDRVEETETTGSQMPLKGKQERLPCPLSAKLYQAQSVNTVSSEELIQLLREAAMEVRRPHPGMSEWLWPEHTEEKSNNREIFLSTQAVHRLTASPSPVAVLEETEQAAHPDEPEEKLPLHNQQPDESHVHISSSLDLDSESLSSFTSASSLPLLSWGAPYVFKSTLTMQRISSLLADGENQSGDEEDVERDSRTPSSAEALPSCSEMMVTLDGATHPVLLSSLDKDGLLLSAEDVPDLLASAVALKDQSDCISSDRSLNKDVNERENDHDHDCAMFETTQDLLTDLHQSLLPEDPHVRGSRASAVTSLQDISLQVSWTPGPTCDIQTTSAPSDTTNESSPGAYCDDRCVDHSDMGNLLKQEQEKGGAAIKSDNKTPPLTLCQPFSQSLLNFMDFTAKQRGENKEGTQADKEEPAGWSTSGRGSQGAIRSGRTRLRNGKRVKRA
ncbi:protein ELYS-like [Labrus mixtus]|uniref:protein ELYS-like n=1 Tax=Labrus mixtus TaxID=508554 RepID=UPI0029C047FB|nr:protein ELYS-like [Labrus mixtus]